MRESKLSQNNKVALVTGGSQRIGAAIVREFHSQGLSVAIHYRRSEQLALELAEDLNRTRPKSAVAFQANFKELEEVTRLGHQVVDAFDRLDVLINNASEFFPTSILEASAEQFGSLFAVHVKAPYFLAQSVLPQLRESKGCIVNITDIYAMRPLSNYSLYCASKAALESLTKSLAVELAPEIRVNAVAPGAILWAEGEPASLEVISKTPLGRLGTTEELVAAVRYLALEATFTTGQILTVDGGRSVTSP